MATDNETPVLIVGAGAAGTMLALELARHGIGARVVDRLPGPSPHSRAVTVHARMLEIFEQIDPKLVATFLEHGLKSPGYVMHYVSPDSTRHDVRPGLDFRDLPSRYPLLLLNSQRETERMLRDYLHERFDREPEWGVTCTAVRPDGDGAVATLEHADGRREQVRCRYLIACDGAGSRLREVVSPADEGGDYSGVVLQNLDVELLDFPDDPDWMHYCMGAGHFLMVAKLPGKFFRLLMSQPPDKADTNATPHHVFGDILAQHFDGIRFGETQWHSRWGSQMRLAHAYRSGAIFLAGDAAHVHSTAGGQGMNCCMQDAWNLGWKLAFVDKGWAPPPLLDSYEIERKPIGRQVIEAASAIHELFMAGRNSGPEALERLRDSGFLTELVGKVSGLSYHYRGDGELTGDGLPQAGDRMPNVPLAAGGCLTDWLRHIGFTLVAALPADAPEPALLESLESVGKRHPERLDVRVLPGAPGELATRDSSGQFYLVRPDGYVALRCRADERSTLDAGLRAWLLPA